MRHSILFILLTGFLFSCSSNNDKAKNEKQKVEQEKKKRWENLSNLALNFGAVAGFDTLRFSLSYEFQSFFAKNNKIILDDNLC